MKMQTPPASGQTTDSATMWAISHISQHNAQIIEVTLNNTQPSAKGMLWATPVDQTGTWDSRQEYPAPAENIFTSREDAVTEWLARLKKSAQSVADEIAKWSSPATPTDTEILAWVEENIMVAEWPFGNQVAFILRALSSERFPNTNFREVALQCIRENNPAPKANQTALNIS